MSFLKRLTHSNGTPSGTAAPKVTDKRREQLRKAQKTHRERNRAYQEALEQEIIHLRAKDSQALELARAENSILRNLLSQNKIPIPDLSHLSANNVNVQIRNAPEHRSHMFLHVDMPSSSDESTAWTQSPPDYAAGTTTDSPIYETADKACQGDSLTQIGINFILYLEHPCMAHARLLSVHESLTEHAFLASTALFQFSSDPPESSVQLARDGSVVSWRTPESQLESLLHLSQRFVPSDEITPVEMWHTLKEALQARQLNLDQLTAMQIQLAEFVKCQGFGSSMARHDFDAIMQNAEKGPPNEVHPHQKTGFWATGATGGVRKEMWNQP